MKAIELKNETGMFAHNLSELFRGHRMSQDSVFGRMGP